MGDGVSATLTAIRRLRSTLAQQGQDGLTWAALTRAQEIGHAAMMDSIDPSKQPRIFWFIATHRWLNDAEELANGGFDAEAMQRVSEAQRAMARFIHDQGVHEADFKHRVENSARGQRNVAARHAPLEEARAEGERLCQIYIDQGNLKTALSIARKVKEDLKTLGAKKGWPVDPRTGYPIGEDGIKNWPILKGFKKKRLKK